MSTKRTSLANALRKAIRVIDAAFEESAHERAGNGQFGSGGGGEKKERKAKKPTAAEARQSMLSAVLAHPKNTNSTEAQLKKLPNEVLERTLKKWNS